MTAVTKYAGSAAAMPCRGQQWQWAERATDVEDDNCSQCSSESFSCDLILETFGFNIPEGMIINEVLLVPKCGCTIGYPGEHLDFYVWNGTEYVRVGWTDVQAATCANTTFVYTDVTSILDTPSKINNVKVRARHVPSGGGGGGFMLPYTSMLDACKIQVIYSEFKSRKRMLMRLGL